MQHRRLNGESVKAIRLAVGLSVRTLAKDIERSPGHISRVERGIHLASPATMVAIAKRLGVPLDAITYVIDTEGDEAAA